MNTSHLPPSTQYHRVIPKNAFHPYCTHKQKEAFTHLIQRITWTHVIAPRTANVVGTDISEIHIFHIALKTQAPIDHLLDVMDKAIPYTLIVVLQYQESQQVSTTIKHSHPTDEHRAVIDWRFMTPWYPAGTAPYTFHLNKDLDLAFKDFCAQLSGKEDYQLQPLKDIVAAEKAYNYLVRQRDRLEQKVRTAKQFKDRVTYNQELHKIKKALEDLGD